MRLAATIGASPAASQPRGVAFASHSVRVSGSSKQSIHFSAIGTLAAPGDAYGHPPASRSMCCDSGVVHVPRVAECADCVNA